MRLRLPAADPRPIQRAKRSPWTPRGPIPRGIVIVLHRHLLFMRRIELLIGYVLVKCLLRSHIKTTATRVGEDIVRNTVVHASHKLIWRQAIQHGLSLRGIRDANFKPGGGKGVFLLNDIALRLASREIETGASKRQRNEE